MKENRPDGDIPQAEIEQAIEEYIAAFAKLAGGVEHVYALDSVGGSYVMASPTCTRPIADAFGPDGRERVFKELRARLDKWLGEVRDNVNDAVPAVEGVFEPDLLNQKNRNYKAPMAVHKSLDGVVTPLDTESPTYEFTHLTDADSELIDDATEWAAGFTDEHDDAVASIVATLWPDEYAEAAGWESALRAWIESERAEEQAKEERRKRNKIRREDRLNELGTTVTGQSITPHIDDIFAAVDAVDVKGLVRNHCAEWEPAPAHRTNHFNPGSALWKESDSGTSCFVNTTKNIFVDTGDNGGEGGAAKFMALKESAISWPKDDHSGEPFWIGVEALRRDGYEIPVYIPGVNTTKSNGETYEKTPHRALRKAALLFGVVDTEDAFITKSGESGFYKTLAGKHRKETLDKLEEHGIEHGWDRRDDQADPSFEEMGVEENPETVDENIERFVANLKMM